MKIFYILIVCLYFNSCIVLKKNTTGNLRQISAENYNYQELLKRQYRIRISDIVFVTPSCGTRAQAADVIGEVEGLGTIRILLLCTILNDLKENDTLCFMPTPKPKFEVSTVYYLLSELTEGDIQRITETPTTFATLVRCEEHE